MMDFVLGEGTDRPIIGAIWYPASNPDGMVEETTYVVDLPDFITAFLLATLKNDADARAALAPEAVSFPGITYDAQGF